MSNFSVAAMRRGIRAVKGLRVSWVGKRGPVEKGSPMKRKNSSQPPGIMRPMFSVWEEVSWYWWIVPWGVLISVFVS